MKLEHKFVVPAPVEDAWAAFNDLERVVPCFPGATLTTYEGDDFTGSVKVKLGPISLQYTGNGTFVERDAGGHHAVIEAKGKDRRGNGSAVARVTTQLSASGPESTEVTVETDLTITGRPAQFGRGLIQEVSNKLLDEFTACLVTKLKSPTTEPPTPAEATTSAGWSTGTATGATTGATTGGETAGGTTATGAATAGATAGGATGATTGGATTADGATSPDRPASPASSASRSRQEPEPETVAEASLDLGTALIPVLLRRARPYVIGAVVALILRRLLRR